MIWYCAATPEGKEFTVGDIRAWHKARGFSDIGYHFVVYGDGRVMLARPIGQIGARVAGHNTGSVGASYICGLSADGSRAKDTRTAATAGYAVSVSMLRPRCLARDHPCRAARLAAIGAPLVGPEEQSSSTVIVAAAARAIRRSRRR